MFAPISPQAVAIEGRTTALAVAKVRHGSIRIQLSNKRITMNATAFIGRTCIYVETGQMCLATLTDVKNGPDGFSASFAMPTPPNLSCQLNVVQMAGQDRVESWSEAAPFGKKWDVFASPGEFWLDDDYWSVSFRFGGGFRIFLNPTYVERFMRRDLDWIDEFFDGDDDEDNEDFEEEE